MGRQPCCDKVGIKRGPWTMEEDHKLVNFILNNGIQCWRLVPKLAGLMRCGKSCRLRWINYLRPDLKRGAFTEAEEDMIIQLHARLGNRWSKIAAHFPGRTDNEIKNHWNTKIKRKLKLLGLDPVTHKPIEQQENDTTKNDCIQHDNSSRQQEVMMTSDSQETIVSQDSQLQQIEGTSNSQLNEYDNLDSFVMENTEPSETFSLQTDYLQPEDPFQYWIGSPLSWDVFSNLGENYF